MLHDFDPEHTTADFLVNYNKYHISTAQTTQNQAVWQGSLNFNDPVREIGAQISRLLLSSKHNEDDSGI